MMMMVTVSQCIPSRGTVLRCILLHCVSALHCLMLYCAVIFYPTVAGQRSEHGRHVPVLLWPLPWHPWRGQGHGPRHGPILHLWLSPGIQRFQVCLCRPQCLQCWSRPRCGLKISVDQLCQVRVSPVRQTWNWLKPSLCLLILVSTKSWTSRFENKGGIRVIAIEFINWNSM